jgi:hypothetical protein
MGTDAGGSNIEQSRCIATLTQRKETDLESLFVEEESHFPIHRTGGPVQGKHRIYILTQKQVLDANGRISFR